MLKESRPDWPVSQEDGTWLVYDITGVGEVYYNSEDSSYILATTNGEARTFAKVGELIAHLDDHS